MAHNRTAIRNAIVALLEAIPTPTALAVYAERRRRLDATLMPCIIISLGTDALDPTDRALGAPYTIEHEQAVTLELHAAGSDGDVVADQIDAMELEVETALASDLNLGGLCELVQPLSSELEMESAQDTVIGVRSLSYITPWRATFGSPDIPEG